MPQSSANRAERVDVILQQIESLPTLSPIALRVLQLSSSDESEIGELVRLIEADAALTGRLLSLCRRAPTGLGDAIMTVDRAVVMLGFDAVRSAVLSVHLHDLVSGEDLLAERERDLEGEQAPPPIDRRGLWRHSLAVACAAELIVEGQRASFPGVKPGEAFVCGLLHDLGKHALDAILPRTYGRVARLAERRGVDIAEMEREIIGVDHHRAGKRLAEHWGLPHAIQDVMWLLGQPSTTAPELPHKSLIGVVTAADAMALRLHLGWSGEFGPPPDLDAVCDDWLIDPLRAQAAQEKLIERVARRAQDLGLDETADERLALDAVLAANRRLGSLNTSLRERSRQVDQQASALDAISRFHAGGGARTLLGAFGEVAASAASLFGEGFYAVIYQARPGAPWHVSQCSSEARVLRSQVIQPPTGGEDLAQLVEPGQMTAATLGMVSWLTDYMGDAQDVRRVRLLPLVAGSLRPALLVHDRPVDSAVLRSPGMAALTATWAASIAVAAQHEGARKLGEQLADANRRIVQTQKRLAEMQSMLRVGELAAGLAHEMNNPLTVIHGRAQLLARSVRADADKEAAQLIGGAASRLSDLITALHFFAKPPAARPDMVDLPDLLARVVRDFKMDRPGGGAGSTPVRLVVQGPLPPLWVDGGQLASIVRELLQNAWEAKPRGIIEVRAHIERVDDRLVISVRDDGCGMSEHALQHAFDPFFSEKPAGRQTGLGLAKARRLADLMSGSIELESRVGRGTTARVVLAKWRREGDVAQAA